MFSDFINILKTNGYLLYKAINTIHGTPCISCTKSAIDINDLKALLFQRVSTNQPASVNAMFFTNDGKMILIYFHKFYNESNQYTPETFADYIVYVGHLKTKVLGTQSMFDTLISHHKINSSFQTFFQSQQRPKIETVVLTELKEEDFIIMNLALMDKLNIGVNENVIGEAAILNCAAFDIMIN